MVNLLIHSEDLQFKVSIDPSNTTTNLKSMYKEN